MIRVTAACLVALAAPLAAQGFEGVVVVRMKNPDASRPTDQDMKYYIKGQRTAILMPISDKNGGAREARMVVDVPAHKATMLVAVEMNGMKGVKYEIDLSKAGGEEARDKFDIKQTGNTETIASHRCDDYQILRNGKPDGTVCLAHDIGRFAAFQMVAAGRGATQQPWVRAIGNQDAFPLRYSSADGNNNLTVISVTKGPVPSEMFEIPSDYMDMSQIGQMFGRGRGRGPGER